MRGECEVIVAENPDDLAARGAAIFRREAEENTDRNGRFSVAVSGGSTPRPMHRLLARVPYRSSVPWQNTHIFWADERMLPHDHPESNYGSACKDFLQEIPIPHGHLHPMPIRMDPEEAASFYESELKSFLPAGEDGCPILDLVYLGIGKDGHTASLFPGQDSLYVKDRWVLGVKGGEPDVMRLTLTLPVLNRAKRVVFLVSGKEKAAILEAVLRRKDVRLPARNVRPASGRLIWLIDRDAASLLPDEVARG